MTTWILIWVVSTWGAGSSVSNESVAIATGSTVFHSQESCEKAAQQMKGRKDHAYCFEDKEPQK